MDDNKQVLLVDDHDLVLQGLKSIIETSLPEINSIFTASDGTEALQLAGKQRFDLFRREKYSRDSRRLVRFGQYG